MLGPSGRARRGLVNVPIREPAGNRWVAMRERPFEGVDWDILVPGGGEGDIFGRLLFPVRDGFCG